MIISYDLNDCPLCNHTLSVNYVDVDRETEKRCHLCDEFHVLV